MSSNRLHCVLWATCGRKLACRVASQLLSRGECPPSSSSVASPTGTDNCLVWVPMAQSNPAPTPAFTQPHSTSGLSYNSPQETALPSMSASKQYGIGMEMAGMGGSCSFNWDQCPEYAATHVFTIPQDDSSSSAVVSSSESAVSPSFKP